MIRLVDGAEILRIRERDSSLLVVFEDDRDRLIIRGQDLDADTLIVHVVDDALIVL